MMRSSAKKAMTTDSQKASYVIDHLIEALANDPGSSLRRALILIDVDQYPNATQTDIMQRLQTHKSTLNREIDWLFNYGCIMRQDSTDDARSKELITCGYSKKALKEALDYFSGDHEKLKGFVNLFCRIIKLEKPTLRDAKIVATLHEKKEADKQEVLDHLVNSSPSTDNRAYNRLIDTGLIEKADEE